MKGDLAYMNMDRASDMLRDTMRSARDATIESGLEIDPTMLAGSMLMVMRGGITSPAALAAMFRGLREMAIEVIAETKH